MIAVSLIGSDVANAYTGMLAPASIVSCGTEVKRSIPLRVIGSLLLDRRRRRGLRLPS